MLEQIFCSLSMYEKLATRDGIAEELIPIGTEEESIVMYTNM